MSESTTVIPQAVAVDNTTLQNVSGVLSIKTNGVGATQLADDAVDTNAIVAANVTDAKLASTVGRDAIIEVPLCADPDVADQGTFTKIFESTQFPPMERDNGNPGAQNDGFTYNLWMSKGTYTIEYTGHWGSGSGILTFQLDGVDFGTIDLYDAVGGVAKTLRTTGCVNSTSGLKAVKIYMPTKNASSSGYRARISSIKFKRTA